MKEKLSYLLIFAVLAVAIFSGCAVRTLPAEVERLEEVVELQLDKAEDRVEDAVRDAAPAAELPTAQQTPAAEQSVQQQTLTAADAERIALEHAGFSADEVQHLRTESEIDDGVPEYQVEFRHGRWEYDYEIHAETGAILSFEKDD